MLFGDSYSAQFNNVWQNLFCAATGMVLGVQRAQSGRHLYEIFSEYVSGGVLNTAALQADLLQHDVIVIYLATNDVLSGVFTGSVSIGSITDAPVVPLNIQGGSSAVPGSAYAYEQGAIDQIQALAPNIPILVIAALHMDRIAGTAAVSYDYTTTNASTDLFNSSLIAVCKSRGHYVVDMASLCGINKQNVQTYPSTGAPQANMLRDGIHPTDTPGFPRVVQQLISGMRRVFGV